MRSTARLGRVALRWLGVVGLTVLLGACGTTSPTDSEPGGTPAQDAGSDAVEGAASGPEGGAQEGSAPPSGVPGGDTAPVEAGEPGLMPDGDGSALELVPTTLRLPADWSSAPADGPHYRTQVCGVDLDPEKPVDAAQRRWAYSDAAYLESEVHLFADDAGRAAAEQAAAAVTGCRGYGVREDGTETALGEGDLDVAITPVPGAPEGWTVWTETTEGTGMVRHVALAPVAGGWHWMSVADLLGRTDPQVLLDVLPTTGGEG